MLKRYFQTVDWFVVVIIFVCVIQPGHVTLEFQRTSDVSKKMYCQQNF